MDKELLPPDSFTATFIKDKDKWFLEHTRTGLRALDKSYSEALECLTWKVASRGEFNPYPDLKEGTVCKHDVLGTVVLMTAPEFGVLFAQGHRYWSCMLWGSHLNVKCSELEIIGEDDDK